MLILCCYKLYGICLFVKCLYIWIFVKVLYCILVNFSLINDY